MISLYKDPDGKKVFSKTTPTDDNEDYVPPSTSGDAENLRLKVLELERRLSRVCFGYWTYSNYRSQSQMHALHLR